MKQTVHSYAVVFSNGKFLRRDGAELQVNSSLGTATKWATMDGAEIALENLQKGPLKHLTDARVVRVKTTCVT